MLVPFAACLSKVVKPSPLLRMLADNCIVQHINGKTQLCTQLCMLHGVHVYCTVDCCPDSASTAGRSHAYCCIQMP